MSGCSTLEVSRVPSGPNGSEEVSGPPEDVFDLGAAILVFVLVVLLCYRLLKTTKD